MVTAQEHLNQILPSWYELLTQWSQDGSLVTAATDALLLDSSNAKQDAKGQLQSLTSQWSAGNFKSIPEIVLLSNADISGAQGAYAASMGKIYLNADWLRTANEERIQRVLTEELGHHLDGLLNQVDTSGDEGSNLSKKLFLASQHKSYAETDTGLVRPGALAVEAEFSSTAPESFLETQLYGAPNAYIYDTVIKPARDGGIYSGARFNWGIEIKKTGANGQIAWQSFPNTELFVQYDHVFADMAITNEDAIVYAGAGRLRSGGDWESHISRINKNGAVDWYKSYMPSGNYRATAVAVSQGGGDISCWPQ